MVIVGCRVTKGTAFGLECGSREGKGAICHDMAICDGSSSVSEGQGRGKLLQEWSGVRPAVHWESLQDFLSLSFRARENV